jgi:hypothetical protein
MPIGFVQHQALTIGDKTSAMIWDMCHYLIYVFNSWSCLILFKEGTPYFWNHIIFCLLCILKCALKCLCSWGDLQMYIWNIMVSCGKGRVTKNGSCSIEVWKRGWNIGRGSQGPFIKDGTYITEEGLEELMLDSETMMVNYKPSRDLMMERMESQLLQHGSNS